MFSSVGNSSFEVDYNATSDYNLTEIELPEETARKELEEFILEMKKDPDGRTSAVAVGRITLILMAVEIACLILLDSTTIPRDFRFLKKSLKAACRAKNKNKPQRYSTSKVSWNSGDIGNSQHKITCDNFADDVDNDHSVRCLKKKVHKHNSCSPSVWLDDETQNFHSWDRPMMSEASHLAASKAYLMSLMHYTDLSGQTVENNKALIPEQLSYERFDQPASTHNENEFLRNEFRCTGCDEIVYCPQPDYE